MDTIAMLKRNLGRSQLVSLAVPLLLGLLIAWQHRTGGSWENRIYFTGFIGFFWCLAFTVLTARNRCSELDLALPVSGTRIWRSHVAATMMISLLHLAVFTLPLIIAAEAWLQGRFLSITGHTAAGLIFTGSLIHRVQPGRNQVKDSGELNGALVAGLIVLAALIFFDSPWLSLTAVVAAGLVQLRTAGRVPEGLTLVDDRAAPKGGYTSLGRWEAPDQTRTDSAHPLTEGARARTGRILSTLWNLGTSNLRQFSLFHKFLAFWFLLGAGSSLASGEGGMGVALGALIAAFICAQFISPEMIRSGSPYAHLPIPRRRIYAGLLLPAFTAIAIGFLLQAAIVFFTGPSPGLVNVRHERHASAPQYKISVAPQYYKIAWDGKPPVVTGGNGETFQLSPQIPLANEFRDNRPVLYNPYAVGRGSSTAFVTEQYARAAKEVYGLDLAPERALELLTNRRGLASLDGLRLARMPQRIATGFIIFALIWSVFSLAYALFAAIVRPARMSHWWANIRSHPVQIGGFLFTMVLLFIFSPALSITNIFFFCSALANQLSHAMPGALLSLLIAVACSAGAYLMGQELFARREVLPGGAE